MAYYIKAEEKKQGNSFLFRTFAVVFLNV